MGKNTDDSSLVNPSWMKGLFKPGKYGIALLAITLILIGRCDFKLDCIWDNGKLAIKVRITQTAKASQETEAGSELH